MTLPLEGIKVLEVAEWLFRPAACAVLADWGAEVVKLEHPERGDGARGILASGILAAAKVNYLWEQANRNKKSVAVDLNSEKGKEIVYKLVARSDVFLTNFLGEARKRLGLEYEDLSALNPRLVYVKVHGYGQKGEEKERGGYDYAAFWARGGVGAGLGEPGTPPPAQRPGFGDQISGMFSAGSIAAALFARERTGRGQKVDVSLLGSALWANALDILASLHSGQEVPRLRRSEMGNPLWNTYKARDGKWLQLVMPQTDRYWTGFCRGIGREDLEHDPRFDSHQQRCASSAALIAILDEVFATRDRHQWGGLLDAHGALWAPIQGASEVAPDPQVVANQYLIDVEHPLHGRLKVVASPMQFDDAPFKARAPAPELGQHTEEVLLELGYTWTDIGRLKEQKVII